MNLGVKYEFGCQNMNLVKGSVFMYLWVCKRSVFLPKLGLYWVCIITQSGLFGNLGTLRCGNNNFKNLQVDHAEIVAKFIVKIPAQAKPGSSLSFPVVTTRTTTTPSQFLTQEVVLGF